MLRDTQYRACSNTIKKQIVVFLADYFSVEKASNAMISDAGGAEVVGNIVEKCTASTADIRDSRFTAAMSAEDFGLAPQY